jgi:hypothetical protein
MSKKNSVLINAIGIRDSGGISVLNKTLGDLVNCKNDRYVIICNLCENIFRVKRRYKENKNIDFIFIDSNSFLYRLYYENFKFLEIINQKKVVLVYNFSGSVQFLHKTPQLIKAHNLLFFSKKLDNSYKLNSQFILWIKQVFLKRIMFKFMLIRSKHIEIQSPHVNQYLSDFINTRNKTLYVKSDIDVYDAVFQAPKQYDFLKKINFLYIVGPHFEYLHKNLLDFTNAMTSFNEKGVDFEINITLTNEQLSNSKVWDASLNSKTNFLGYISDQEKMTELFCDNTILISTSIIETLGLHVLEGIKNGVITITPDELYANTVYGGNMFQYELFNKDSLVDTIMSVINCKESYSENILTIQDDLRKSEMNKFSSILDVFDEVLNVQK